MRTEAIENEAKTFNRDHECYVHFERPDGGPYAMVFSGDPLVIIQGLHNLMCGVERDYGITFKTQMKTLKAVHKACPKMDVIG